MPFPKTGEEPKYSFNVRHHVMVMVYISMHEHPISQAVLLIVSIP